MANWRRLGPARKPIIELGQARGLAAHFRCRGLGCAVGFCAKWGKFARTKRPAHSQLWALICVCVCCFFWRRPGLDCLRVRVCVSKHSLAVFFKLCRPLWETTLIIVAKQMGPTKGFCRPGRGLAEARNSSGFLVRARGGGKKGEKARPLLVLVRLCVCLPVCLSAGRKVGAFQRRSHSLTLFCVHASACERQFRPEDTPSRVATWRRRPAQRSGEEKWANAK